MNQRKNSQLKPLTIAISLALGLLTAHNATANNLRDVIQHTISTNPDILINKNEYRARREEIRQAEGGYYPTVDVNAGAGYEWTDNTTIDDKQLTRKELGLTVVQNIFDGHGTTNEVERHRARARATAHQIDGDAEQLGLSTVQVYIQVCRQQRLLGLARKNLDVHTRIHDQIRLRSESGVGRKADLDQIEARMALAESNIVAAKVNLRDAKTNYVKVVGEEAGSNNCNIPNIRKDLPDSRDEAVQLALENHPILKSAYADVDAATEQHEASAFNMYPRLDFELGATHNDDIDGVDGKNRDVTAMLRMRWNLYNGGKDSARRRETAHQINQAKDIRDRSHRQVEESTRLSWDAFKATNQQMSLLRRQVNSNIKTRDAYVQQFNLNERTLLDVLNTENDLYQSRQELVNAEMDNSFAQYRIAADLGIITKIMNIAVYDEENLPEYPKAISIPDYTDAKYPNNEYMDVTKDHHMEVIGGPKDEDDFRGRSEAAEATTEGEATGYKAPASNVAAKQPITPEPEAVADIMAHRLTPNIAMNTVKPLPAPRMAMNTVEPSFILQDISIRDIAPSYRGAISSSTTIADNQPITEPIMPENEANPPSVKEETGGNSIAGFWKRLFN